MPSSSLPRLFAGVRYPTVIVAALFLTILPNHAATAQTTTAETTSVQTPATKTLSGADDPHLKRAVDDWLDGKTLFPLIRLAALARQGNVAARLLLSSIGRRFYARDEGLSVRLTRRQTSDTSGSGFGKSWRTVEAKRGHPLATVLSHSTPQKDQDAWKARVKTLLAWGERERAILEINSIIYRHRHLVEFAETYVTPNDIEQWVLWSNRWSMAWSIRNAPDTPEKRESIKKWSRHPWTEKEASDFRQAFDQGLLSAILFQWDLNLAARSSRRPVDYANHRFDPLDRMLFRWDLQRLLKEAPPTLGQYRAAGGLLVAEARRGGSLRPLYNICRMNCSEEVALCMHAGVVLFSGPSSMGPVRSPLESVIPRNRWLASPRARSTLLTTMRGVTNYSLPKLRREGRDAPDLGRSACFSAMMDPAASVRLRTP